MGIGIHSQSTFVFGDTKFSVIYASSCERKPINSSHHAHSQYEFHIFSAGSGYISGCGKTIRFTKNTAVLIAPGTVHEIKSDDNDPPIVMGVTFSFKKAPSYAPRLDAKLYSYFEKYMPKEGEIAVLKDKFFGDFAKKFAEESESDPIVASVLIINLLEALFLNILRLLRGSMGGERVPLSSYRTTAIANDAVLARNIEDYLRMNGCTLTTLSSKLNMSPRNTQKILKKLYGVTFSEKIAEIKLNIATQEMIETDLPLSEISKIAGYNQYPTFRRAFIKEYGVSPSEYREKKRKEIS